MTLRLPALVVVATLLPLSCCAEPSGPDDGGELPLIPADKGKVLVEAKDWDWEDSSRETWRWCESLRLDSMGVVPSAPDRMSRYGSWADGPKFDATGFFRVEKYCGRWVIVDPDGLMHIDAAVVGLTIGSGQTQKLNFTRKWGEDTYGWIDTVALQFGRYGFNGAGCWSDEELIKYHNGFTSDGILLSYCPNINLMSDYAYSIGVASHNPGNTAYPNRCIPVFDPAFRTFCEERVPQFVAQYKDDPEVLGYFTDNEMPLLVSNLDGYLALDEDNYGRLAAESWLRQKGILKSGITDADRREFAGYVARTYFRIVSKLLKKHDPDHMYLGSRFAGNSKYIEGVYKAAAEYCDIVSINYYGYWSVREQDIALWEGWADRPWMITEFYTKGEDSGLPNTTGAGWTVHTQADRGIHYENFIIGLLRSSTCVGWSWLKYQDNDPTTKGAEASNIDSNKGFVDNRYEPYEPLVTSMTRVNNVRYSILSQHWNYRH